MRLKFARMKAGQTMKMTEVYEETALMAELSTNKKVPGKNSPGTGYHVTASKQGLRCNYSQEVFHLLFNVFGGIATLFV